jgi:hypothetical protein
MNIQGGFLHSRSIARLARPGRLCLLLAAIACGAMPVHAQSGATPGAEASVRHADHAAALAAARQGLADFVQRKQQGAGDGSSGRLPLDVPDASALSNARVAYGFEVHTIAPKDIIEGRTELARMVRPTGIWRFVVRLDARPVGLVTVDKVDGRWQAVSFGGSELAREVDALMAVHADATRSNVRFIRIYQAQSDLLEVVSAEDGQARYAPLRSAREALAAQGLAAEGATAAAAVPLQDSYDLIEPLRAAVKKNMDTAP